MVKAIIFDFDGTLVKTLPVMITCVNELSDEYGFSKLKNNHKLHSKDLRDVLRNQLGLYWWQVPGFVKKVKQKFLEKANTIKVVPGIEKTLQQLSKQYELAIVTTNSAQIVKKVLGREHLKCIHSVWGDSSLLGKHRTLKKAVKALGYPMHEVIYVGDEIRDEKECRKLGMSMVGVTWGFNEAAALRKFQLKGLAGKPSDLLKIVQ